MHDAIELVCRACTRTISLEPPIYEALATAEIFGWKPDGKCVICPKCKGGKRTRHAMLNMAAERALSKGTAKRGDVLEVDYQGRRVGTVTV